ncbi:MAG: serine/threonine protein kinase [Caulobacter sp.]|nr:serine/threonine protein kinase [Vitreoscilla sp.]
MSVSKETWGRLSPLLDELLDLPDAERQARLDDLRIQDAKLADAVTAMLQHLPAIERGEFMPASALPKPTGLAGQSIGPYSLVREIGQGGMGTVWLARRTDGRYEGEVAIKFLRSGLFGHGDAARFEREGSILARLSHPHIARLLDAGVVADGTQPYLVLEYIDGEPIDQYCQRLALPVAARLALMLDVLAAVAQAHNRLILHRDLKPSNILVTKAGEVKLLDFGIAKLLDDAGGDQTALTARAGNAFTPEFAAPEQLQGGDVTTATDVYALGVLLYLLLGGEHPTALPTGAPLDRMRSVIETVPKRLSEAVLRRGGPTQRFSPESRKLATEIKGDIETIVAKALKKAPAERYANAAELADDIRRYLGREPITARPDTPLYRATRFVQRHTAGVAMAGVAVTALGAGIGVALWQASEARAQRVQAEGLVEYMIGDLRKKLQPVGRLDVLDGVGVKALDYYAAQDLDRLDADSLGRRARAFHMIGSLAEQRGRFDEAVRDFQLAADTTGRLLQAHPDDPQRIFDQSQSEYWVGYVQWYRGRLREAETSFRRYQEMAGRMNSARPGDHGWQLEDVFSKTNVGIVLTELGRADEALPLLAQARAEIGVLARSHPEDSVSEGNTIGWNAIAYAALGRDEDAIRADNDKIAAALRAPNADKDQDAQFLVANGHDEIAKWERNLGHLDNALALANRALAELMALNAREPNNVGNLSEVVSTRAFLVYVLADRGDLAGAREHLRQASALQATLMARPTPKRAWRLTYQGRLAEARGLLAANGDERAAARAGLAAYMDDVHRYESEGGVVPPFDAVLIASAGLMQGDLLARDGQAAQARDAWQAAANRIRPLADRSLPSAMTQLGQLDLRLGGIQDARAWADKVLATTYRHPAFTDLQQRLGPTPSAGEASRP